MFSTSDKSISFFLSSSPETGILYTTQLNQKSLQHSVRFEYLRLRRLDSALSDLSARHYPSNKEKQKKQHPVIVSIISYTRYVREQ